MNLEENRRNQRKKREQKSKRERERETNQIRTVQIYALVFTLAASCNYTE
jgi:hypothetical protein